MGKNQSVSFIKNSFAYSGTNILMRVIQFIREFVVRRILPPEIMGFWNLVTVIQGFIGTFDLGCIAGAMRELPMIRGKKDQEEETKIRSATLWFTFVQNIVIGVSAIVYIWWNRSEYVPWEIVAAVVAVAMFIILSFHSVYMTFYQGAQAFVPLSKILFIGAVIDGVGFPFGAYMWGLGGLMSVAVINSCLKVGLFIYYGQLMNMGVRWKVYKDVLKRLLSFGFFLRVVDYPNAIFTMANILWVTKFMNIESLALFSMARGFSYQISDTSTRIGTVYAMRYLEQAGAGTPRHVISAQMKQFLIFQLLLVIPIMCWGAGVALPFIVNNFIPKYSEANGAILILLMCSFFFVTNSGLTNPWVMEKRLGARGAANAIGLCMMGLSLAVTWFVLGRHSINDVAYSSVAGYFFYFVYMVIAVGKDLWRPWECVEIILSVSIASVWTFAVLYAGYVSVSTNAGFIENLKSNLFMAGWTLFAFLPIPLYGLWRSQIMKGWRQ